MDRGRRILVHYAVAIAIGGTGACDLHRGSEPVRATRSFASVAVPVTVAATAECDLPCLTGLYSVRAFFTGDIRAQVAGKLTSRLSKAERVVVPGPGTLPLDRLAAATEPPTSAVAKRSGSS